MSMGGASFGDSAGYQRRDYLNKDRQDWQTVEVKTIEDAEVVDTTALDPKTVMAKAENDLAARIFTNLAVRYMAALIKDQGGKELATAASALAAAYPNCAEIAIRKSS